MEPLEVQNLRFTRTALGKGVVLPLESVLPGSEPCSLQPQQYRRSPGSPGVHGAVHSLSSLQPLGTSEGSSAFHSSNVLSSITHTHIHKSFMN